MFVFVNLHFFPVVPLPLSTLCKQTTNSGEQMLLDANDNIAYWNGSLNWGRWGSKEEMQYFVLTLLLDTVHKATMVPLYPCLLTGGLVQVAEWQVK